MGGHATVGRRDAEVRMMTKMRMGTMWLKGLLTVAVAVVAMGGAGYVRLFVLQESAMDFAAVPYKNISDRSCQDGGDENRELGLRDQ